MVCVGNLWAHNTQSNPFPPAGELNVADSVHSGALRPHLALDLKSVRQTRFSDRCITLVGISIQSLGEHPPLIGMYIKDGGSLMRESGPFSEVNRRAFIYTE